MNHDGDHKPHPDGYATPTDNGSIFGGFNATLCEPDRTSRLGSSFDRCYRQHVHDARLDTAFREHPGPRLPIILSRHILISFDTPTRTFLALPQPPMLMLAPRRSFQVRRAPATFPFDDGGWP